MRREQLGVESLCGLQLPHPLRPYQWDGVRFLTGNTSALLADEMGLGKTVQVAVGLGVMKRKFGGLRSLVVAPACLKLNWEAELRRWAGNLSVQRVRGDLSDRLAFYHLPINVLIASYDEVRIDVQRFAKDVEFDVVILDEAQRIKNAGSRVALACKVLRRKHSWALTGTPIENNTGDLVSIFGFVKFGSLYDGLSRSDIHKRIFPYFLRRCKADVASDLPPIVEQEIPIELEGAQRLAYMEAWESRFRHLRQCEPSSTQSHLLAILTKLKQLCNYDPASGQSAKLEALNVVLENQESGIDKTIVFSQYVRTLKWLSRQMEGIRHGLFHGGLSDAEKATTLQSFKRAEGPGVLLMSLRAGGVGLNIQEASTVVLFDRWWNPALENQAIQRAHRFGRNRPLQAIKFLVLNTVEERIQDILSEKQQLFDDVIETARDRHVTQAEGEFLESVLDMPAGSGCAAT